MLGARAALEAAQSDLVKAKFDLDNTLITAPGNGRIGRSHFYEGRLVSAQTALLTTIDQLDPMYVNVGVPESYLLRRRRELAEQKIQRPDIFQLRGVMTFSTGAYIHRKEYTDFADVTLRSETGMLQARFTFPNPEGGFSPWIPDFYPDSSSKFVSRVTSGRGASIPQRAVQQGPKGSFVYVIDRENKAELQPVLASTWRGNEWLIESGLRSGDRVVVEGFHRIQPGIQVNAIQYQGSRLPRITPGSKTKRRRRHESPFFY